MPEKNPIGRPPLYKTAEELQAKIKEYFDTGVKLRKILTGTRDNRKVELWPVPTITGLVSYCGFCSRQSFYDYEKKSEFTYTIKKARLFIEQEYEEQLVVGNCAGAIFALKNFGWTDKQEIEHSGGLKLTSEERENRVDRLKDILVGHRN